MGISEAFGGSLPDAAVEHDQGLSSASRARSSSPRRSPLALGRRPARLFARTERNAPALVRRLNQRTFIAPASIVERRGDRCCPPRHRGRSSARRSRSSLSLYSFGALIAFTAAQLAVIRLRFTEPDLARPPRPREPARPRRRGAPCRACGCPLTFALWIAALYTTTRRENRRPGLARPRGDPLRRRAQARHEALLEHVGARRRRPGSGGRRGLPADPRAGEARADRRGDAATAIRLAEERGCSVRALHVIHVPLELPLDAELMDEEERRKPRSPRRESSPPSTGSRSRGRSSGGARSARRSSTRRRETAST